MQHNELIDCNKIIRITLLKKSEDDVIMTWEFQVWNYVFVASQNFFKSMARWMISMKAEYFLIMCGSCIYNGKSWAITWIAKTINYILFTYSTLRTLDVTITKAKAWNQVVFIKGSQSLANNWYGLLIWVRCISNCMQAFLIEWDLAFKKRIHWLYKGAFRRRKNNHFEKQMKTDVLRT